MFKTPVQRTQFNTEIANEFFGNITGGKYMQDDALLCMARAILPPRMKEGDHVHFHYQPKQIRRGATFEGGSEEIESFISSEIDLSTHNLVTVYYFAGARREDSAPYMEAIQEHFAAKHKGWVENERVRAAYGRMFPIISFANTEKRSVVLFMGEADYKRQRFAIQGVFASMPWYFNAEEHPLSDDERALLISIIDKDDPEEVSERKFYEAIDRIAAQYDFEKIRVTRLLDGFETRYERRAIERVKNDIERDNQSLQQYNAQIRDLLKRRNENNTKLMGLQLRLEKSGEASDIRDLFLSNPHLCLEQVSDDQLTFSVKTDLEFFNEDMMERFIANDASYVYMSRGSINQSDMPKLLRALFIDRTLKLQVCGGFSLEMYGEGRGLAHHDFPAGFADYMPNTHINEYHCLGDYHPAINECIENGNYVGAIMQCIASCQSLNFGDPSVFETFMRFMYDNRYSGIRLPDGRVVKPSVAIEWLKAQEVQSEQKEPEAPAEAEA